MKTSAVYAVFVLAAFAVGVIYFLSGSWAENRNSIHIEKEMEIARDAIKSYIFAQQSYRKAYGKYAGSIRQLVESQEATPQWKQTVQVLIGMKASPYYYVFVDKANSQAIDLSSQMPMLIAYPRDPSEIPWAVSYDPFTLSAIYRRDTPQISDINKLSADEKAWTLY